MAKKRLLFIDLMKIFAIILIVVNHIQIFYNTDSTVIPFIGPAGLGRIGLILFIICSGASLQYNYPIVKNYFSFVYKRLARIYPAYWCSLLIGALFLSAPVAGQNIWTILDQGLSLPIYTVYAGFDNKLFFNMASWFVGLIAALYLLYPVLTRILNRLQLYSIPIIIGGSLICREMFFHANLMKITFPGLLNPVGPYLLSMFNWYTSPISNIGFFFAGMVIIKYDLYPHVENKSHIIMTLSELTFYVFLVHWPLLSLWFVSQPLFFIGTLLLSLMLMEFDMKIKQFDLIPIIRLWVSVLKTICTRTSTVAVKYFYGILAAGIVFAVLLGLGILLKI